MRLNIEISKSAVLLANDIKVTRKNVTNDFRIDFRYVFIHAKMTVIGMPENVASRRILTKTSASVFHRT